MDEDKLDRYIDSLKMIDINVYRADRRMENRMKFYSSIYILFYIKIFKLSLRYESKGGGKFNIILPISNFTLKYTNTHTLTS